MAELEQTYPFPFFGAGEARYYMWAEVHVRFAREPSSYQRSQLEAGIPQPVAEILDWCDGRQLMVASGLSLHSALVKRYPLAEGERDRLGEDGWLFAAPSRVAAFNAHLERWLHEINRHCPVLLAYRGEDRDGGGTDLSDWHEWSLLRLPELMPCLTPILEQAATSRTQTHATAMVRGVAAMARRARVSC
ncbi:hypothetical protein [Streptosporangium sp. KLBMP 9127]|nr:hypothetical protein [Streptosporangium sp. KLBMP 9127]